MLNNGGTLLPGQATTVSGTRISVASNGLYVVVGSSTEFPGTTAAGSHRSLNVAGETITAQPNGDYVIGSQTLHPGDALTVSGTRVSLASDGRFADVGSSAEFLGGSATSVAGQITAPGIDATPAASSNNYVIDGCVTSNILAGDAHVLTWSPRQTLTPGGVITVPPHAGLPGEVISLSADGSSAVINGSLTETLGNTGPTVIVTATGASGIRYTQSSGGARASSMMTSAMLYASIGAFGAVLTTTILL